MFQPARVRFSIASKIVKTITRRSKLFFYYSDFAAVRLDAKPPTWTASTPAPVESTALTDATAMMISAPRTNFALIQIF